MQHGELTYGLVVAVDIENFGRFDMLCQLLLQTRLNQVLDLAAHKARLDRDMWYRQVRGDGELAILPPDTDVAWVLADFTERLIKELGQLRSLAERAGAPTTDSDASRHADGRSFRSGGQRADRRVPAAGRPGRQAGTAC